MQTQMVPMGHTEITGEVSLSRLGSHDLFLFFGTDKSLCRGVKALELSLLLDGDERMHPRKGSPACERPCRPLPSPQSPSMSLVWIVHGSTFPISLSRAVPGCCSSCLSATLHSMQLRSSSTLASVRVTGMGVLVGELGIDPVGRYLAEVTYV